MEPRLSLSMNCPDDNLLARAQARELTPEEAAAYQQHLDECPPCLEVAMVLGCIADAKSDATEGCPSSDDGRTSGQVFTKPVSARAQGTDLVPYRAVLPLLGMVVGHGYWSYEFVPLAWKVVTAERSVTAGISPSLEVAFALYVLIWGVAGLCWSGMTLAAVKNGWNSAGRFVRAYVILSGPTVALIPLCLCTWFLVAPKTEPRLGVR